VTQATESVDRSRQDELDELIESARKLPGVAEVVDTYGKLMKATEHGFGLVTVPDTVSYATGGNAS
jgi:hypothetical protein